MTNSPSFLRHAAFFGPEDSGNTPLNIVGVGATGSWVAVLAAKMGWTNFVIWDKDTVESHNVPNQAYDSSHIGMLKVDALEQVLKAINPIIKVQKHSVFWTPDTDEEMSGALFIAVDSLDVRKELYQYASDQLDLDVIFETRIGFNMAVINILDPIDQDAINDVISVMASDSEVEEAPCNERIITTLVSLVAANLTHYLCAYYSSFRNNTENSFPKKTVFSLTHNNLEIFKTGRTLL
jgi:tRNA A37 threonylcarbamoyladenosine dehydratase